MAKRKSANSSVDSLKHKHKRKNIPTAELQDFVKEDEVKPKKILYPRDPSLDPQLVWKGKDEQDQKSLEVPAVPVYIQEKIHPQVLIEDLRRNYPLSKGDRGLSAPEQPNLFADFNGIEFEDLIEFYQHEQNCSNRLILGNSLLVMNSLAEKEGIKGKVQMIYVDPPYGIRFGSNWQVSTRKCDIKDGKVEDLTRQPEQIRAFRDTWELGIHSYLSYLRDRLVIARELLTETGSVFVQIGDENVHLVRCLMDKVMGSENFISIIVFQKTGGQSSKLLASSSLPSGSSIFRPTSIEADTPSDSTTFSFESNDVYFEARSWKTNPDGMKKLIAAKRIMAVGKRPNYVRYLDDFPVSPLTDVWVDTMGARGDELLKETGAGNLFMIFGEPDIKIEKLKDNIITIEIKGLDVYDPTTGQIRSHSTDDIACWFIDTDYNEESFFVRHAYFSGADEPYEKLRKALKADRFHCHQKAKLLLKL